jgi:hypothetical protein
MSNNTDQRSERKVFIKEFLDNVVMKPLGNLMPLLKVYYVLLILQIILLIFNLILVFCKK